MLEGGYNLDALASSVAATMAALSGDASDQASEREAELTELADRARQRLEAWWPAL